MYINKPKVRKRQARYTHRRRYAERRLYDIVDEINRKCSGGNYKKIAYYLTLIKGSKMKFNIMSDDCEPIVVDIKKVLYRAVANGLRFVYYLMIDHHLKKNQLF